MSRNEISIPDPEVVPTAKRRGFTTQEKVRILKEAEGDVSGVADRMISHLASFSCATFEAYVMTKAWHSPEEATMVYVKFRDNAGNISEVVTDMISWQEQAHLLGDAAGMWLHIEGE